MTVSRELDGGELSIYEPDAPCGCFFETVQDPSLLTDPPSEWAEECVACEESDDCESGECRRGFCEVR